MSSHSLSTKVLPPLRSIFSINNIFLRWLHWYALIIVSIVAVLLWQASKDYVHNNQMQDVEAAAVNIQNLILSDVKVRKKTLLRMAHRWNMRVGGTPYQEWSLDAFRYIADDPGYKAIDWVDPKFIVRWVVPLVGNETAVNFNLGADEHHKQLLQGRIKNNTATLTGVLRLQTGNEGFLIYAPIGDKTNFKGYILAVVDAKLLFDKILNATVAPGYDLAIYSDQQLVYQRVSQPDNVTSKNFHKIINMQIDDSAWSIDVWPTIEVLSNENSWVPALILISGLFSAALVFLIIYFSQIAIRSARNAKAELVKRKAAEQKLIIYSTKLEKLTLLDGLTGVDNRRSLENTVKKELAHLHANDHPLSILLLDLDNFKKINDTYGHVIGDHVLQKIGSTLLTHLRSTDVVARYGGEEFCIVLPNTTASRAYIVAEKLRQSVAMEKFFSAENKLFHVTCSIGVYQVHANLKNADEVFTIVDRALYAAKNAGRNCVVIEQTTFDFRNEAVVS